MLKERLAHTRKKRERAGKDDLVGGFLDSLVMAEQKRVMGVGDSATSHVGKYRRYLTTQESKSEFSHLMECLFAL